MYKYEIISNVTLRFTVQKGLKPPNICFWMILVFPKGSLYKNTAFEYNSIPLIAFFSLQAFTGQWFWGHCPERAQVVKINCPSFFFFLKVG